MGYHNTMNIESKILQEIVEFFVNSHDFNGIPLHTLAATLTLNENQLKIALANLIRDDKISINFDSDNPHILRRPALAIEDQLDKFADPDFIYTCAYPTTAVLTKRVKRAKYKGRPFSLRLAHGEPQLFFVSFDLSVLEMYRNDPRYSYSNNDIGGSISIHDDVGVLERDQVFLQTFGFSYDANYNRAVAVFLRYLAHLSPEHQQIWAAKVLEGDYKLHPDYFGSTILGEWYEGISVFEALLEELHVINEMCNLIGRPTLFRSEFREGKKPKEFSFLIRPTLDEFNSFIHTLDKVISENLRKEFFLSDIPFEREEIRRDGKIVVSQKGTIQLLDDWLKLKFRTNDPTPLVEMIDTFKEIRKLRQKPAHAANEDIFDQKYYHQQRDIIKRVYVAVSTLREIFSKHPQAREYKIPDCLKTGTIWMQ